VSLAYLSPIGREAIGPIWVLPYAIDLMQPAADSVPTRAALVHQPSLAPANVCASYGWQATLRSSFQIQGRSPKRRAQLVWKTVQKSVENLSECGLDPPHMRVDSQPLTRPTTGRLRKGL
jgi:hypothetical protein